MRDVSLDNRSVARSVSPRGRLTRGKDHDMTTQIDWRHEIDASFGSGDDVPVGHYVAAGRRAVRRRRTVAVVAGLAAAAVVAGVVWGVAPGRGPAGSEAPVATDPDGTSRERGRGWRGRTARAVRRDGRGGPRGRRRARAARRPLPREEHRVGRARRRLPRRALVGRGRVERQRGRRHHVQHASRGRPVRRLRRLRPGPGPWRRDDHPGAARGRAGALGRSGRLERGRGRAHARRRGPARGRRSGAVRPTTRSASS